MSLIDKTYFVFDINIPDSDYNDLTTYITRYEKEILMKLLGFELYTLVAAYNISTSPQRIKDIVEGKEYETSDGKTMKWMGLANADKISLIAYYVYYWFVKNRNTTLQGIGTLKLKGENSENARAGIKISTAWHRLKLLYGDYGQGEYIPSAYNFLMKYESEYPEWVFEELGTVNNFDL